MAITTGFVGCYSLGIRLEPLGIGRRLSFGKIQGAITKCIVFTPIMHFVGMTFKSRRKIQVMAASVLHLSSGLSEKSENKEKDSVFMYSMYLQFKDIVCDGVEFWSVRKIRQRLGYWGVTLN